MARPNDAGECDDDAGEGEDGAGADAEAVADEGVDHDDHHGGDARGDEDVRLKLLLHLGQTWLGPDSTSLQIQDS